MKRFSIFVFTICFALAATSCRANDEKIAKILNNDSDFDLCFLDNVANKSWDDFSALPGFGVTCYIPARYGFEKIMQSLPEYQPYVSYAVTAYPDYADDGSYITRIEIKDPSIRFFGFTLSSAEEDVASFLTEQDFKVTKSETELTAEKGAVLVRFRANSELIIQYNVSNRQHIDF